MLLILNFANKYNLANKKLPKDNKNQKYDIKGYFGLIEALSCSRHGIILKIQDTCVI